MRKKIIISRLFGGLGNQLFIFASSLAIAKSADAELVLDDHSGFISDYKYKRTYQLDKFNISSRRANFFERLEPMPRLRRKLKQFVNSFYKHPNKSYIEETSRLYDPRMMNLGEAKIIYLEGYWQTEKYFLPIADEVKSQLMIQAPADNLNQELALKMINDESVCIHIRFFDEEKPFEIVEGYYEKALKYLASTNSNLNFYLFSDQPERARAYLNLPSNKITLIDHNKGDESAFADLWLMSQCKYFIVSNSSFSWWGAWLASNKDKAVLRPYLKIEDMNDDDSKDFYPTSWIRIS